jgi:hypothetical protein
MGGETIRPTAPPAGLAPHSLPNLLAGRKPSDYSPWRIAFSFWLTREYLVPARDAKLTPLPRMMWVIDRARLWIAPALDGSHPGL